MDPEQAMRQIQAQNQASRDKVRMLQRKEAAEKRKNQRTLAEAGLAVVIVFLLTNESMKESLAFLSRWFAGVPEHPRFSEQWVRQQVLELDEATKKAIQSGDKPPRVQSSTYRKVQKFMADLELWKSVRDVNNRAGVSVGLKKMQQLMAEGDYTRPVCGARRTTSETTAAVKKRVQRWRRDWNVGRGTIPVGEKIALETMRKKATAALQSSPKYARKFTADKKLCRIMAAEMGVP